MGDRCIGGIGRTPDHSEIQVILKAHRDNRNSARFNYLDNLFPRHMNEFTVVVSIDIMLEWVLIRPIDYEVVSAAPLEL